MSAILRQINPGEYQLQGSLNLDSVVRLLTQSEMMFHKTPDSLTVDLATVQRVESAGLALLVEWRRRAGLADKQIRYLNVPSQLIDIAQLSGVDDILSLKATSVS